MTVTLSTERRASSVEEALDASTGVSKGAVAVILKKGSEDFDVVHRSRLFMRKESPHVQLSFKFLKYFSYQKVIRNSHPAGTEVCLIYHKSVNASSYRSFD